MSPEGEPRASGGGAEATRPANLLVVLLDSLNRHHLGCYGGTEFETPNLDRFAARGSTTRFTNHVTGSLPCMPARHDILVGALDFLWRCWGSIEMWESSIVADIRAAGVPSVLPSPTTPTCSRPAARTTTPTSRPGTTSGATRATRGGPTPTRPGSGPPSDGAVAGTGTGRRSRRSPGRPSRAAGSGNGASAPTPSAGTTTTPAPGSAPRRTTRARPRWPPPPTGSATPPPTTTAGSASSTSSTPTSPSTPLTAGSPATRTARSPTSY